MPIVTNIWPIVTNIRLMTTLGAYQVACRWQQAGKFSTRMPLCKGSRQFAPKVVISQYLPLSFHHQIRVHQPQPTDDRFASVLSDDHRDRARRPAPRSPNLPAA